MATMHNNTQNSLESSSLSNLTEDNVLNWYNNKRNSGNITFLTGDDYSEDMGGSFDPKVFWCVNAFIFVLLVGTIVWCCFCDKSWLFNVNPEERRQRSDEIYRRRILAQRQRQEQAKQETPAKRTKKLLKSFAQNKVQMTVKAEDLIEEDPRDTVKLDSDNNSAVDDDIETGSMESCGHLKLANGNMVPNCCAICLTSYEEGDTVIWSSNQACAHAFHQDCVVGWLVKMQPETPCPCCRQEFTDLENVRKESKVKWSADNAFNIGALSLR